MRQELIEHGTLFCFHNNDHVRHPQAYVDPTQIELARRYCHLLRHTDNLPRINRHRNSQEKHKNVFISNKHNIYYYSLHRLLRKIISFRVFNKKI